MSTWGEKQPLSNCIAHSSRQSGRKGLFKQDVLLNDKLKAII